MSTVATTVWPPPAYDGNVRFDVWETQLKMFFKAKKLGNSDSDSEEKTMLLLQHIGSEMLEKIIDWVEGSPETMKYDDLITLVRDKCTTKSNLASMRLKLFSERQKPGQSVFEFCDQISQGIGRCKIKNMTPEECGILLLIKGLENDELRRFCQIQATI